MQLPEKLRQHKTRGKRIAVTQSVTGGGLSIVGTKTLLITDLPALYLHDTGGILGDEQIYTLKNPTATSASMVCADQSSTLKGKIAFNKETNADFELSDGIDKLSPHSWLRSTSGDTDARFCSRFPLSIQCKFTESNEQIQAWIDGRTDAPLDASVKCDSAGDDHFVEALSEHLTLSELYADVLVTATRLRLDRKGTTLADIPLSHIKRERKGERAVKLSCGVMVSDHRVSRITIWFCTKAETSAFLKAIESASVSAPSKARSANDTNALADLVQVRGRVCEGRAVDEQVDAFLDDDSLELRSSASGKPLCRFDLTDSGLRIAGSNQAFVILSRTIGPLAVTSRSAQFGARLYRNERITAAARRTLENGPFPLLLSNDEPVAIELTPQVLAVVGAQVDFRLAVDSIQGVLHGREGETQTLTLRTNKDDLTMHGQCSVLQALGTAVQTQIVHRRRGHDVDTLAKAVLGLEGRYFAYAIFGPILELHAILAKQCGSQASEPLALPDDDEKMLTLASSLAQGVERIRRHLDGAVYYLPSFIVDCDTKLVGAADARPPRWLKEQEARYRNAVSPLRQLTSEVTSIHERLNRIAVIGAARPGSGDLGSIAISLVGGSLINPFLFVSGAQQAYGMWTRDARNETESKEMTTAVASRAVAQWNYLVHQLLPGLSHFVSEGLFPPRRQVAAQLSALCKGAHERTASLLSERIAHRLAKLETYLRYPEDEAFSHTRAETLGLLEGARECLHHPGFQPF